MSKVSNLTLEQLAKLISSKNLKQFYKRLTKYVKKNEKK